MGLLTESQQAWTQDQLEGSIIAWINRIGSENNPFTKRACLLVFHNLGYNFQLKKTKLKIESFLRKIAENSSIALIVTMEDTESPPGIQWTRLNSDSQRTNRDRFLSPCDNTSVQETARSGKSFNKGTRSASVDISSSPLSPFPNIRRYSNPPSPAPSPLPQIHLVPPTPSPTQAMPQWIKEALSGRDVDSSRSSTPCSPSEPASTLTVHRLLVRSKEDSPSPIAYNLSTAAPLPNIRDPLIPLRHILANQATSPPQTVLLITCAALKPFAPRWPMTINPETKNDPITISHVLFGIHSCLHNIISHAEWNELSEAEQHEVKEAYRRRCDLAGSSSAIKAERNYGVRRIDFLRENIMFDGLEPLVPSDNSVAHCELLVTSAKKGEGTSDSRCGVA